MTDKQKSKAVIGAGTMGTGIAVSLARAGCDVLLFDKFNSNPEIKYRAEANILRFLAGMRNISRNEIASRIKLWDIDESEYLHQIIACDAIVEAIYENLDHKKKLYNQIRAISNFHDSAPIPIYSNTSTIQCSRLVEGLQDHEYFMVLHFFSPVPMSRVVEFVTHGGTNEETIRLCYQMKKLNLSKDNRIIKYAIERKKGVSKKEAQIRAGYPTPTQSTRIEASETFKAVEGMFKNSLLSQMSVNEMMAYLVDNIRQEGQQRPDRNARNRAIEISKEIVEPKDTPIHTSEKVLIVMQAPPSSP